MVHREPSVPIDHNGARRWTPVAFQTVTRGRLKNGARRLTGGLRKTGEGRREGGPGLRQSIPPTATSLQRRCFDAFEGHGQCECAGVHSTENLVLLVTA